jgi:hypothetical protein
MIRGVSYSKPLAAAGAASIVAACAMYWLRAGAAVNLEDGRRRAFGLEGELAAQIVAWSGFDDGKLSALRDQVKLFRVRLGPAGTWERLIAHLGDRWTEEGTSRDDRNGCTIQLGAFSLKSPSVTDWPRIVEALRDSEALPGVGITEFQMKASGSREHRSIDLVRFRVAVRTRRMDPKVVEIK